MRKDIAPFILVIIFCFVFMFIWVLIMFMAAETVSAAETFTESDTATLSLRGPGTITVTEERTVIYRVTVTNKGTGFLWLDIESPELELYEGVFLTPGESVTLKACLTVTPADEGELLLTVMAKRLRAELLVTAVVVEERGVEKAEWPPFMLSAWFYELVEDYGLETAIEMWRAEYRE